MPSLRQLLARHPVALIIDACSTHVEASVWRSTSEPESPRPSISTLPTAPILVAVAALEGEASVTLPVVVARALAAAKLRIQNLDAACFCAGPGSVLGIRLSAATVRAWRAMRPELALFSYASLHLLAVAHPGRTVIADARRETWHVVRPDAPHHLLRVAGNDLKKNPADTLATPAHFRRWSALPPDVEPLVLPYSAATLLAAAPEADFFTAAPEPDAFQHEAPGYAAWTPRIHQAPAAR